MRVYIYICGCHCGESGKSFVACIALGAAARILPRAHALRTHLYMRAMALWDRTPHRPNELQIRSACCSVLRCVAVCCSELQCVVVCCNVLQCVAVCCCVLLCVAVCCNVLIRSAIFHVLALSALRCKILTTAMQGADDCVRSAVSHSTKRMKRRTFRKRPQKKVSRFTL